MTDITLRSEKGEPLTNNEVDTNFTNLNDDKAENGANSDVTSLSGITGGVSEVDYVDFDTDASSTRTTGRLRWNDTDGTLEVDLKGSDVTLQIGQESMTLVQNNEADTLANGEVVYFSGASNGVILVERFIADGTIDYEKPVGIVTESIATGEQGYLVSFGFVRGLDTSSLSIGDSLYADAVTAGAYRVNHPASPNIPLHIGTVSKVHATEGTIFANVWSHTPSDESIYDNSGSTLTATNVKAAIDELDTKKADLSLLHSNVNLYPTTADSDITGYKVLVTNILDDDYDTTAVNVSTGSLTLTTDVLLGSLAAPAGVFEGDIGGTNVSVVGNIRRTAGNADGRFKFEVYHRAYDGTETIIGTSGYTDEVNSSSYVQLYAQTYLSSQTFTETCRLVIKFYGKIVSSGGNGTFDFQYGGTEPVRALFPVDVSVVPTENDADNIQTSTTNFAGILSGTHTNVQLALDAIDDHGHGISGISGLQSALDGKATSAQGALADSALQDITGESIEDLSDVNAMTPTDGQLLTWDNANSRWDAADAPVSLPDQSSSNGYFLTTNGTSASWVAISQDQTVSLTAGSNVTITGTYPSFTIASTDTDTTYSVATSSTAGLVKIGYTESGKNYPVELDSDQMYVNVPWTDTDTTYGAGNGLTLNGTTFNANVNTTTQTVSASGLTTTASRTYQVQLDSSGYMVVNVPWVDTNTDTDTTYSAGTGLTLTGTEFSVTANTYAPYTHNHDGRYYTETEIDDRLNGIGTPTVGATTTIDFSKPNASITLTQNTTIAVSNLVVGQTGTIIIKQDATGGRTFTLDSKFKTPNGDAISQITTANSLNAINYFIVDANTIICNYLGDFS